MRDEIKFTFSTSWKPNRGDFLTGLGVSPGGFGEELFGTVYDSLFETSIEVKSEFRKYYSVEYSNLAEYVELRYGESLSEDDLEADLLYLVTWCPLVIDENYEGHKLDAVFECISKLEKAQNENQT